MKALALSMLIASLGACAGQEPYFRDVPGPDGTPVHEAFCGGNYTFGDCMAVASNACSNGKYEIIGRDSSTSVSSFRRDVYSYTSRDMIFKCKDGQAKHPEPKS